MPPSSSRVSRTSASAAPPAAPVIAFLSTLWAFDHALQRLSKSMKRRFGVTGPQRLAVRMIGLSPGISAGQLATALAIHPSTLSGVLRRLEQARLVSRQVDPRDARRVRLQLTAGGRRVNQLRGGTAEEAVSRGLARLSADDVEKARLVLDRLQGGLLKAVQRNQTAVPTGSTRA